MAERAVHQNSCCLCKGALSLVYLAKVECKVLSFLFVALTSRMGLPCCIFISTLGEAQGSKHTSSSPACEYLIKQAAGIPQLPFSGLPSQVQ